MMFSISRLLRWFGFLAFTGVFLCLLVATGAYYYLAPGLPSIESLKSIQLQVPLRVYTREGKLIREFGEKKRIPLTLDQIPEQMVNAVIASEDDRFFEHPGVDWQGLTRAVVHVLTTGEKGPGGSTITMQVARNFFLGREKTYLRKANEILLALKIESELSKNEILELYLNKIFLGQRAYGVGAAAQVYYGKKISELTLPEISMIAGLPQAPSRFNPIANPSAATNRRQYVLNRMLELNYIDQAEYDAAVNAPVVASLHDLPVEVEAHYVAEMVRAEMVARYGEEATSSGYKVYTTLSSENQMAANHALRTALLEYDQRHGYRGAEFVVDLAQPGLDADAVLRDIPTLGGLIPGLVMEVSDETASVFTLQHGTIEIPFDGVKWARRHINENSVGAQLKTLSDVLKPGDIIRVVLGEESWRLSQVPDVEGALVSIDPMDGAVLALTGGFDFSRSKFNRAVQAQRQPGSSFKPFIYSAALDYGYTTATLINDAPVVFEDVGLEDEWRPENYSRKFFGPTRMREALTRSRNLVSIRLLRAITVEYAMDYIARFGFDSKRLPSNLSLALGTGTVTPMEMATAYAVLANGGYKVEPYFIDRITHSKDGVIYQSEPYRVCRECPVDTAGEIMTVQSDRVETHDVNPELTLTESADDQTVVQKNYKVAPHVISEQNAWLMGSMLRDVIRFGTGRRAMSLKRNDLSGKTGTTNDQRDAWFSGYNANIVTTAWVGFDQLLPLGRSETGGRAALPMWIYYMGDVLGGQPDALLAEPEGLVRIRIDPETGQRTSADDPNSIVEVFRVGNTPSDSVELANTQGTNPTQSGTGEITEQLF